MLTSVHILLTYSCPLRCDHCFVFASPQATGKVSPARVSHILEQALSVKSIEWVIFEGGEPFLVYPLLLTCVKHARKLGFKVGVITNGYFGRSEEAAIRYLKPLAALGLDRIYVSNDRFHYKNTIDSPAKRVIDAAIKIGIPTTRLMISESASPIQNQDLESLFVEETYPLLMVGRADEKIHLDQPLSDWRSFTSCPFKELQDPDTIFIDPLGNTQICQGISIGNIWEDTLPNLMEKFEIDSHPIYGPIVHFGPKGLADEYRVIPLQEYQNACQLCYAVRRLLLSQFPEYLSPPQVYNYQV
jgi:hypothetical protein